MSADLPKEPVKSTLSVDFYSEDLIFTGGGAAWWVAANGGPDLSDMADRQRVVLRALLELALKRLDQFEVETGGTS